MNGTVSILKPLLKAAAGRPQTVGDGFEIRRPMPGPEIDSIDPFLVLDHAGPTEITPTDVPRGVDEHPHRGFETVTIVLQGAIDHRDSAGNKGHLRAGDVQWMTAGSGVVHEEKHGREIAREGGIIEIVQLWVNLPGINKMTTPRYQDIPRERIPTIGLPERVGTIRVISGEYGATIGPAETFTPVTLFDIELSAGADVDIPLTEGHTAGLYVVRGEVTVNEHENADEGILLGFGLTGDGIRVEARSHARFLIIGGRPIGEEIVAYGPFVMNTMEQIREAIDDYRAGRMGTIER